MSASQYFFQVQIDYLAYYGRPADPAGQLFWAKQIDLAGGDNTAVINAFANSQESLALFGPITSANISQVVTLFYLRDFNRLPDPAGLAFYVNGFNNHTFTPATIALNIFNGATGDDAVALGNKIHVANIISQEIAGRSYNDPHYGDNPSDFTTTYSGNGDADHARDFMQNVHSDAPSVPSDLLIKLFLQNIIANPGDSILLDGQTFVLTPQVDAGPDFEGGAADNKYFAAGTTLTAGDNLDGGGGDNSFLYQSGNPNAGGPVSHSGFMTKNIQNFFLTADVDTTLDMSGTKDVVWVTDINSAANLTLTHGPEITKALLQNPTVAHCLTIDYQASTVSGGADKQVLWLDGALAGSKVKIDGIETMNVTTLNNDSSLWTIQSDSLKTFNLDGTKSLTLDHLNFPGAGTLTSANKGDLTVDTLTFGGAGTVDANNTGDLNLYDVSVGPGSSSIDASGIGGSMDLTLDNAADGGRIVAVTGSGQGDTLDVQNGFNLGDSANLGGGDDEIVINASNFSVGTAGDGAITNTEIADLLSGIVGTFDLGMFDTVLETVEVNTTMALTTDFDNVENNGSEQFIIDAEAAHISGTTNHTINFHAANTDPIFHSTPSTANVEIDNVNEDTTVTFGGFDDNVATLNLALFGDSDVTFGVHLDPVTTLGLSGNVNIDVTSDAPTVETINGGTTTGDVNIEDGVLSDTGATVTLGSGQDTVIGGDGSDSIDIGTGGGFVAAGTGNDTVVASGIADVTVLGGDGNDSVTTAAGSDSLVGGNGADTLSAGAGNDHLEGNGGVDSMNGGAGDDTLWGGFASDTMTGGIGNDTFHYEFVQESQGAFVDKITDFVSGVDQFDLLDALINAGAPVTSMADVRFVGNVFGVAAALSALTGSGQVEIVYDTQNFEVYVDVNGDGLIDGTNDMVINLDPPATLQASDFGIPPSGNVFTAVVGPFNTGNPADSQENTTTSNADDTVDATGAQVPGSTIHGLGGTNTLNITTPLAAIDLSTVMDTTFANLNIDGTTGPVIGPDQTVSLHVSISSKGGDFTTGANLVGGISQFVSSGNGNDTITLSNTNDSANTRGGNDVINTVDGLTGSVTAGEGNDLVVVGGAFDGIVNMNNGSDEVEVGSNAAFGTNAVLDGGGDSSGDDLELFNNADVSAASLIIGFDHVTLTGPGLFGFNGNATMSLRDYNNLTSGDKIRALGDNTLEIHGAGTIPTALDTSVDHWLFDNASQTATLGNNSMDVSMAGGNDTLISTETTLHGTYDGGTGLVNNDTFVQTVDANFTTGTDATFSNWEVLQLADPTAFPFTDGVDVTMSNSQHNSFGHIDGANGSFGEGNVVTITDVFNGTTSDSIEQYVLNGNGATTYNVGGDNQLVTDNNTAGHTVNFNNGLFSSTLNTVGGNDTVNLGIGDSFIAINTDGGNDSVSAVFGGTSISINTGANDDTVNLNGTHTGLSVNTGADNDTVNLNGTLSGTVDTGGGNDTLVFAGGDYHNVSFPDTFGAGDTVNLAGSTFTFNGSTYNNIITAAGATQTNYGGDTIHISNTWTAAFSNDAASNTGKFQHLVMDSAGNDTVNFTSADASASLQTLDIGAGGSDKISIANTSQEPGDNNSYLEVTGFATANDQLKLSDAGNAALDFLAISSNGTALTVANHGVAALNIPGLIGHAGGIDVTPDGAVESLIAGAVGAATAGQYFFVGYASDGNAYLYDGVIAANTADLVTANLTVEVVGQLDSVALGALGLSNFYA